MTANVTALIIEFKRIVKKINTQLIHPPIIIKREVFDMLD